MKSLFVSLIWVLAGSPAGADQPTTHGMIVFGTKATYASHLPMFHHPHDYQVLMKIGLTSDAGPALAKYEQLKAGGEKLFTLAPQPMDLTQVMNGSITKFKADLFHGHFERGGINLGPVTVTVEHFIINAKLDPNSSEKSQFVVFGAQGEYFAAHLINGKPSFDYIASITKPAGLADSQLPAALTNAPPGPAIPVTGQTLGEAGGATAAILQVIYLEQNELAH